jgi:threonine/homoserine/homoserine lactone efflux protein
MFRRADLVLAAPWMYLILKTVGALYLLLAGGRLLWAVGATRASGICVSPRGNRDSRLFSLVF